MQSKNSKKYKRLMISFKTQMLLRMNNEEKVNSIEKKLASAMMILALMKRPQRILKSSFSNHFKERHLMMSQ